MKDEDRYEAEEAEKAAEAGADQYEIWGSW